MMKSVEQVTAERSWIDGVTTTRAPRAQTYRLELRSQPDKIDEVARLRQALKVLLRRFGFRCLRIERVADAKE